MANFRKWSRGDRSRLATTPSRTWAEATRADRKIQAALPFTRGRVRCARDEEMPSREWPRAIAGVNCNHYMAVLSLFATDVFASSAVPTKIARYKSSP
jgi:hypothetical protein